MAIHTINLGCRLNAQETELMRAHARAGGLDGVVIVNTCAVTGEAQRQARQAVRRAKRDRPNATVIATGCAVQTAPEEFLAMDEADRVLGNAEKLRPEHWTKAALSRRSDVGDVMRQTRLELAPVEGAPGRARAYLQVQNGCDHRCTFCVIPYGRGNARSLPIPDAVAQARRLVEAGHAEIVLTGVDLTSWGPDLGEERLGDLCAAILEGVPDLIRLRLSSVDGVEIDDRLIHLISETERLAPHLHLSLQSGDSMILKRMKRRHVREDAIRITERLRALRPDIAFGADVIAGFPTESEGAFENTLSLVDACGLDFLHVFPFSPRPGTPAAKMPPVDRTVVKERAARLREKADAAKAKRLAWLEGRERQVLVEKPGSGRTECFAEVALPPDHAARPGAVFTATMGPAEAGRMTLATPGRRAAGARRAA